MIVIGGAPRALVARLCRWCGMSNWPTVSMPSATTSSRIAKDMATIARTISASSASCSMPDTKERSIFTFDTGKCRRWLNDE